MINLHFNIAESLKKEALSVSAILMTLCFVVLTVAGCNSSNS